MTQQYLNTIAQYNRSKFNQMQLNGNNITLRAFKQQDAETLATLLNNSRVVANLRDYIPFPYTPKDAMDFIHLCQEENPRQNFAIEHNKLFVGSIGLVKQVDVYRKSAEIGYWIGEPYWGKGIATEAAKLITAYGFEQLELLKIFSAVFDLNKASQRVLEKAGYKLEAIIEKAIYKNHKLGEECRYGCINPFWDKLIME